MGAIYAIDDEFEINDREIESKFPINTWNRLSRILRRKLRVREFQVFFKSINRPDRARIIRSVKDIEEKVTEEELEKFENKDWNFSLPPKVEDYDSLDYYNCLSFKEYYYRSYLFVFSTYDADKDYDDLYSAVSEKIEAGMELELARELAENVRERNFPRFDTSVAHAAAYDCLCVKDLESLREERANLNVRLWNGVVKNKKSYCLVLGEIYSDERHFFRLHEDQITRGYFLVVPEWGLIGTQFYKFCDFVSACPKVNSDGKVDDQLLRTLADEFAEKECVIDATYSEYCKERMQRCRDLGLVKR